MEKTAHVNNVATVVVARGAGAIRSCAKQALYLIKDPIKIQEHEYIYVNSVSTPHMPSHLVLSME